MDVENIEKRIQEEKNRHQRELNSLRERRCAEDRHYQRQMEYLQGQMKQAREKQKAANEKLMEVFRKNDELLEKLERLLRKASEEYK